MTEITPNDHKKYFSEAVVHESAHLHVSGEACYIDDIPEVQGTVYCALGTSNIAHGKIKSIDVDKLTKQPGVVGVITAKDIPGVNDCGPINNDDPILADGVVQYVGQPVFAVMAKTQHQARSACRVNVIDYEPLDPVLTPQQALKQHSFVIPPMQCSRGDYLSRFENAPMQHKGEFSVGGQEQFYLEGQISYALPLEDGCIHLYCSTQHPSEMQQLVANCLKLSFNQVTVEMPRMGGGFGGKESQSALFACLASIAANLLNCPVKLRLDRDDDILITGKRHCFDYHYSVGFDETGLIHAVRVEMLLKAGFSTDLSPPVAARAVCHFDNAYYLSDVEIKAICAKTNTQSNTAFRGFGGPQGAIAIEYIIDDIATLLQLDPLIVRKRNFYAKDKRDVTPYGQKVEDNVIADLIGELEDFSHYAQRRATIKEYNKTSELLKKGIAITPVKFGISFNVVHYNQAGALVHIYLDGSVIVNHGGTEMGQGLNTKVAQVVANVLGINCRKVKATSVRTDKIANTSATAASTGSDLNGKAAEDAAMQLKHRIATFMANQYNQSHDKVVFKNDRIHIDQQSFDFVDVIKQAYRARVQLWSDGFYKTPKLHWDKVAMTGRPFYYFAYGAAVSEVIVDTLTGEFKLQRVDILHDAGNSINPAIDIGQVEGGFIQGMGWLTMEQLWWDEQGVLKTHSPSTYKIPAVNDCPNDFNVKLFNNINHEDTVARSKAVGEPPLLLAFSVFFAIRDAISSLSDYRICPNLDAPATPEMILNTINDIKQKIS